MCDACSNNVGLRRLRERETYSDVTLLSKQRFFITTRQNGRTVPDVKNNTMQIQRNNYKDVIMRYQLYKKLTNVLSVKFKMFYKVSDDSSVVVYGHRTYHGRFET